MIPVASTVFAVFVALCSITGWNGDATGPYSEGTVAHNRGDDLSWRSTLLSVIEPFYDGDCGCGVEEMFEKNKVDSLPAKSREMFVNTGNKHDKDTNEQHSHKMVHQQHRDNVDAFKQRFTKKSKMMENFLEDFDLLFLLTSSFQIYLIFKMVSGKGVRRTNNDEESLRLSNTLGLLLHEDHIADKYRTEIEELAKTIEYLNRKCADQEEKLKKNNEEIKELNSTVKRLQDSIKTVSPSSYRGSKFCSFPSFTELYRFQVPIDDSIFEDEPPFNSMTGIIKGKELFIQDSWED